jgi:hypothetical protein
MELDIITDDDTHLLRQIANAATDAADERAFYVLRRMARKLIKLDGPNPKLQAIADGKGDLEVFSCMARRLLAHRGARP